MNILQARRSAAFAVRNVLMGGIAVTALMASSAQAQTTPVSVPADPVVEDAGEDIVVKGTRPIKESQEAALKAQKASDSLVSVISADAVGRLPDQNIAQAVGRLPGIGVVRDQGQARYVNLRGAPLTWTTLAFDGINIISPEGRDARFDSIPSAIAAQIVVRKAVTPDLPGETIAGNINIITRSPFDYSGLHFALRSSFGKVDLGNGNEYENTAVLSNRWNTGIGEIGLLVSGTYYERQMATDNMETDYETVTQDLRPAVGGETLPRIWARETENKLYRLTRRNYSGTARLEWKPDSNNRLFATSIYSAFTDNELRWNGIYDFDDQQPRVPNAATPCTSAALAPNTTGYADVCFGNTPLRGTVHGIDINFNALSREFLQSVFVNTVGGDHEFDAWKVSWRANYTQSIDDRSAPAQINYESPGFGTNGVGAVNRPTVVYDLTNPQLTRVELYRTLRAADGTLSRGARVQQFEDFPLTLNRIRSTDAVDTTNAYSARFDVTRKTEILGDTKIQFGFQFDNRVKSVDEKLLDVSAAATLTAAGVPLGIDAISIPLPYQGALPLGFSFRNFGESQINGLVNLVRPVGSFVQQTANFYKVTEEIFSGYAMATTTFDWGNIVYGARVEGVRNDAQAFSQNPVAGQPATLISVGSGFISAYPSLHANWNVTDEHKIRLSLNTGAARPDYPILRPNFTFNDPNMTISGGNPNATPERTRGVDLYYEFYPRFGGFFSVGAYYKDVRDVLFSSSRVFGSDVLNIPGVDRSQYVLSTTLNGGGGEIYGAEAALAVQLGDLIKNDKWYGGFGLQANVTVNRSNATTPNGRRVNLPGTSDLIFNIGPYYEKYGFSVRAQYQYRTDYLDSLGDATVGGDFFWATDDELDVSVRYAITKNFELYADLSNLLNGPGRRFVGERSRTIERETFGRRYTGGFRLTF